MNKSALKRNFVVVLLAAIMFSSFCLTAALPDETPNNDPYTANPDDSQNTNITPPVDVSPPPAKSTFRVTTDYGYKCTKGDASQAIQNAINSLPAQRTEPCNIYLRGTFNHVSNITMSNNINFVGNKTTIVTSDDQPIFIHSWGSHSEPYGDYFKVEGDQLYHDWITLQNVTFQSITFKQLVTYSNQFSSAIYFYDGNSSGWGRSNSLNVFNCSFNGFYNCIQGIAMNSSFVGNRFYNYSNNGIMFPLGGNLTIQNNVFRTPANPFTVKQYQKMYGSMSLRGGIGLFLMDVNCNALISNNTFWQGKNSTGLTFSSCPGSSRSLIVTENLFSGSGKAYSIDVFPRPWQSSGVVFFNNTKAADFC
jgi:hypothetical protein